MKLIDLLVQHLGSNGGWPSGAGVCAQDNDGEVCFYTEKGIHRRNGLRVWSIPEGVQSKLVKRGIFFTQAEDMITSVVCREQYEAALAASKYPEWVPGELPTMGTKCEWQDKITKDWVKVVVVYASEWVTVIREQKDNDAVELAIENYGDEARRQFRPIRTEAEPKHEDAKNAIAELCRASASNGHSADLIYDAIAAGKIPGIKLAD